MIELREIEETKVKLTEAKDGKHLATLKFPWNNLGQKNLNGRTYSEEVMKKAIAEYNEKISQANIASQLEHPTSGQTELDKASHFITKVWIENGQAIAEGKIMRTSSGRDLFTMIKDHNIKLGASSRGWGTVDDKGNVNEDFALEGIDIVSNPSSGIKLDKSNLSESYTPENLRPSPETLTERKLYQKYLGIIHGQDSKISYDKWKEIYLAENIDEIVRQNQAQREKEKAEKVLAEKDRFTKKFTEDELEQMFEGAVFAGFKGTLEDYQKLFNKDGTRKQDSAEKLKEDRLYEQAVNTGLEDTRSSKNSFLEAIRKVRKAQLRDDCLKLYKIAKADGETRPFEEFFEIYYKMSEKERLKTEKVLKKIK